MNDTSESLFKNKLNLLFKKIIETFWSRDVSDIWVLAHFETKNQARKILNNINSLCAKLFKCFLIYILRQNVSKNQTRKILNYIKSSCIFFCGKRNKIFTKIFELCQVLCILFCGKMFQYFCTIDAH